eukprot:15225395-Ditylum_brightwellii.AAC.1
METWKLGSNISCDEQTHGFQGNHANKQRITYKAEGGGFQCDAICKKVSPLHAHVLFFFDQLNDKYYRCGLDNLYMSVKFAKLVLQHKVYVHGVTRKDRWGLPSCVLQEEVTSRTGQLAVQGTTKAASLHRDPKCDSFVAVYVYNTKPVHSLTTANSSIKWIEKTIEVYSKEHGKKVNIKFLHLNINDEYNNGMGRIDVADLLRSYYRYDHWIKKRKWWLAIFWWSFDVY